VRGTAATDFRDPHVNEGKQVEFLVHRRLPWELVLRIGVRTCETAERARAAGGDGAGVPLVELNRDWYY